jgi:hypothetical protein
MINDNLVSISAVRRHLVPVDQPTAFHPGRFRILELDIKAFIKRERAPRAWGHRVMNLTPKNPETFYPLKCSAVFCRNGPRQLHLTPDQFCL